MSSNERPRIRLVRPPVALEEDPGDYYALQREALESDGWCCVDVSNIEREVLMRGGAARLEYFESLPPAERWWIKGLLTEEGSIDSLLNQSPPTTPPSR